jgi:hypothetical protein
LCSDINDNRRIIPQSQTQMKVQQALDSDMKQSTRETIRSFKESNQLVVNGTVDDYTGRELGKIRADGFEIKG